MFDSTPDELQFAFRLDTDADDVVVSIYHYVCTVAPTVEYLNKPVSYFLDVHDGDMAELHGHGLCRVVESQSDEGRSLSVFVEKSEVAQSPKTGHLTDYSHFSQELAKVVTPATTIAVAEALREGVVQEVSVEIGLQCCSKENTIINIDDGKLLMALPDCPYRSLIELKNEFGKRSMWAYKRNLHWVWGFAPTTDLSIEEGVAKANVALAQARMIGVDFSYAS